MLDSKDFWIAAGGTAAFLLGWRRVAGAIWAVGGLYEYGRNKKIGGVVGMIGGASFLLFPDWPSSLVGALSAAPNNSLPSAKLPPPQEFQPPPYQKASYPSLDRMLDGDWTMIDVRDIRSPEIAKRAQNLKPGDVASLVLRNKNGPYLVFNARVISGGGGVLYAGQWLTGPPVGGPQMPDWGPEHVFAVH